ncbi:primosomal protein N' family DNA-binding protein, partial [Caballeronia sp. M23-90]
MSVFVRVALDHPLATLFDYRYNLAPTPLPGMLVQIPFGRRDAVGMICEVTDHSDVPADKLRDVVAICSALAPLAQEWRALTLFAADYYQRGLGEVALRAQNLRQRGQEVGRASG